MKTTTQQNTTTVNLPVSLAPDVSATAKGAANAATLLVMCPVAGKRVKLQRCAFCARSEGLLLNPLDDSLTLRCRIDEPES